jgi:hypothetical protein
LLTLTGCAPCPFCDAKSIPLLYPWEEKFKSTLHPDKADNVQMVTARFEACKQQALLGYRILLEAQFAHANLPVMILNVIFLISYRIL